MTKHSEFDVNLKASPIEQCMQNAREYAERIHKLSKKVYWEMVKLRHESTESYNEMIDAKQALQEAHKVLNEVRAELKQRKNLLKRQIRFLKFVLIPC